MFVCYVFHILTMYLRLVLYYKHADFFRSTVRWPSQSSGFFSTVIIRQHNLSFPHDEAGAKNSLVSVRKILMTDFEMVKRRDETWRLSKDENEIEISDSNVIVRLTTTSTQHFWSFVD